ncbi:nuclear RNA binding protein, putative [Eimeria maxima]|uniref:Nuclear RNA binding protein, putative n=1 Tax=Eimeria maxima TaxID=5804 RepID=U6M8B9_EIMMA|nr:nuclear RNA binding protein, putative [Eimeria maxima]CDJ57915.1 nuclear RNA binding protein, putative [Eimeria maxima]
MKPQKYYTVGVSNKFAAFGADSDASSDEGEVILAAPPPPTEQQQQQGTVAAAKKKTPQQQQQQTSPQRGGFGGESRGGGFRGYRQRSLPDGGDELITPQEGEGPVQRRRGGGGGFRGRARGAAGAPGGPPMQRRDGTGRGREVKKHGAGNHNWGQEEAENHPVKTDALLEEDAAAKEVEPEVAGETPEERTGEEGGEEQSPAAPEEEAIDLETYKRMQEEKRANLPSFVSADGAPKKINTDKELEAQGYVRVVREEDDGARSNEEGQDNREDKPKKKSVNLYEANNKERVYIVNPTVHGWRTILLTGHYCSEEEAAPPPLEAYSSFEGPALLQCL